MARWVYRIVPAASAKSVAPASPVAASTVTLFLAALTYALRYQDALAGLIVGFSAANIASALDDPRTLISPQHPAYASDLARLGLELHSSSTAEEPQWVRLARDSWVLVQGRRPLIVAPAADPGAHLKVHFEEIVHFDVGPRLHEIRVPTLVVCGRQDPIVPVDRCAAMQEGIHGAELLVLDHTAHGLASGPEEDVALFRRAVTQFLARLASQHSS